jgi:hypothetical protein
MPSLDDSDEIALGIVEESRVGESMRKFPPMRGGIQDRPEQ